jgi:hypothetical protein
MRVSARMDGLEAALQGELDELARATTVAMEEAVDGLKQEYRDQTFRVLGKRVAYAWQGNAYPESGTSLDPAGYVYSNAPAIIDFFSSARVHTPLGEGFAIPVNPVIKRGGLSMSPHEVELYYNAELQPRPLPSGNLGLFLDLIRGKSKRRPGFRRATEGRLRQGRSPEAVLMFVIVRTLTSKELLDLEGPANRWAERVGPLIEGNLR